MVKGGVCGFGGVRYDDEVKVIVVVVVVICGCERGFEDNVCWWPFVLFGPEWTRVLDLVGWLIACLVRLTSES